MIKKLVTISAFAFVFTSLSFAGHHATDEMKKDVKQEVKKTKETNLQKTEKEAAAAKAKLEKKMGKAEAKKKDVKKKIQ